MNNYKLFINSAESIKYFSEIEWSDNIDSIGAEFSFKSLKKLNIGDKFLLTNNGSEVIRGIITDESYNKNLNYSYSGFDYGFYLNKNEVVIQFNKMPVSSCIQQLCNKINIPCGNIANLSTSITKIYKDAVVYDIIKDLLDMDFKRTGFKHRIEINQNKVDILDYNSLFITANYQLTALSAPFNVQKAISSVTFTNSIQDMKNSVIVVDNKENSGRIKSQSMDSGNISKYGLLQQVETANDDKGQQAVIASNILKDADKIQNRVSVEMLGADNIKAARVLNFNYPKLSFVGNYQVKTSRHGLINQNNHKVSLELELYTG